MKTQNSHWAKQRERGNMRSLLFVSAALRVCGLPLVRLLAIPVALYYFLFAGDARRASIVYLQRVTKSKSLHRIIRMSLMHFICFAQCIVDRAYVWWRGIDAFPMTFTDKKLLETVFAKRGKGCLIIVSHLGNFDIAMSCLNSTHRCMCNIIMSEPHAGTFNRFRNRLAGLKNTHFIDAGHFNFDTAVDLIDRVSNGEVVVVAADRSVEFNTERNIEVEFFGAKASFPIGAYVLGHVLKVPVYTLFAFRDGKKYDIHFNLFAERIDARGASRFEDFRALAQRYALILEGHCRRHPLQWYNFYDFWM